MSAASVKTSMIEEVIRDDIEVLERVPCQFWACNGPDQEPEDCVTCFVCWRIWDLRALLRKVTS